MVVSKASLVVFAFDSCYGEIVAYLQIELFKSHGFIQQFDVWSKLSETFSSLFGLHFLFWGAG